MAIRATEDQILTTLGNAIYCKYTHMRQKETITITFWSLKLLEVNGGQIESIGDKPFN